MRVFVQTLVSSFPFLVVFTVCISNLSKSLSRKKHGKQNPPGPLTSRIFRETGSWSFSQQGFFFTIFRPIYKQDYKFETLRKRDLGSNQLSSRISLSISFDLKVPLPGNTTEADLNQTTEEISSNLLLKFNRADVNLKYQWDFLSFRCFKTTSSPLRAPFM